ncbi:hypothetical protein Cgig2_009246 [Carnegiea gigantea]|uniref:Integral membrane bound transporter domain-containing protein n=1 Tax=Carnegiea gigantea TaxID=171969 RepID=A0A9Q1K0L1_9CARY|nr:hypothetical protein Cgig2_009246 [Carnegiea gigantea]
MGISLSSNGDEQSKRTQALWKTSLITASRTALACIIVASITLFGPTSLHHQVAFPAFSYVTVILIITNAALGDTLRGCCHAVSATVQTVCPAILCLSVVGPARLSAPSTALVVAVAAFFITLPESTHLVAKRIALGQLVIVYVIGYINGEGTHPVMHPVHVAASTAVKENSKFFAENASSRLKLFVMAFYAEDSASSQALVSQAKCLAAKGRKFLQNITSKQESMHWERFPIKFLRPYCKKPGDRFQELEMSLKGMEIAFSNMKLPVQIQDEQLKERVNTMEGQICQNLEQIRSHLPCERLSTVPEVSDSQHALEFPQTLQTLPSQETDLPSYFFLFCLKLLYNQSRAMTTFPSKRNADKKTSHAPQKQDHPSNGPFFKNIWANRPTALTKKRLLPAFRCSLSLGLAVLLGLYYSKPDGLWAGLPVAISLAAAREPTFRVANVKAQGTVLGTVYGVLGCFVFGKYVQVRFIALIPWFVFTSFLQQSKMYGQAGGVSAVIGAVLILGRKDLGPPSEFAIARIVETVIGLSCSIMVELLLQPTRAASLAKVQLSKTLVTLQDSLSSIDLRALSKEKLIGRERMFKNDVTELGKFVGEAEVEPNFWFLPFQSAGYRKLLSSLSKMADLLLFLAHAIGSLEGQIQTLEQMGCKEELDKINGDLGLVGNTTESSIKCLEEISSIESLIRLEKDFVKNNKSLDPELGKSKCYQLNLDEKEMEKINSSFLDHFKEVFDKIQNQQDDQEEVKNQVVMSLSALGFCLSCLLKETREVEKGIRELLQCENPTAQVNLNEILCKIHALNN